MFLKYIVAIGLILVLGCGFAPIKPKFDEKLQPDGKTWKVSTYKLSCLNLNQKQCDALHASAARQRGQDLCGEEPQRVFGCVVDDDAIPKDSVCYVKCN